MAYGNPVYVLWLRRYIMRMKILKTIGLGGFGFLPKLCFILFMSYVFISPNVSAETKLKEQKNCNIQEGSCTLVLSGFEVTLDILPKPVKAMRDLTFRVRISGKQPSAFPHIDLGMPGMKMGPNRVVLKEVDKGTYEGTGVIVKCPSGRRTWKAKVTFPDLGEVTFIFDVIY